MFTTEITINFDEKRKADSFKELCKGRINNILPKGEILSISQKETEIFIDQIDDKNPEIEVWDRILRQYFPGTYELIYHSVDEDNEQAFTNDPKYENKYFVSADSGKEPCAWWHVSKGGIKNCLKKFDFPIESKFIGNSGLNQAKENFSQMYPEGNLKIIRWLGSSMI